MSLALIQESAKEVRRLSIAGSPLAVGDFRLKKLAAPLEQAGTKVPVFAQVAKAIHDVVNGSEADSAANLLTLSTLLNAILYTQGQSSEEGPVAELESYPAPTVSTRIPARLLKPLVHALTSTGSGRFETVRAAVASGGFNDLRLISPSIQALGDIYPELADLVADTILPGYGIGIVPLLKSGLDLKGKKCDARRLKILHTLDPEGTLSLCKTALEDASSELKVAAIQCLGSHEDCLPLVLEQTKSKNKSHRAAALEALAANDLPQVATLFKEWLTGPNLEEIIHPIRRITNHEVIASLLTEGKQTLARALKNDASAVMRYMHILRCLERRTDAATEEYLASTMTKAQEIAKIKSDNGGASGTDIVRQLAELLYTIGSPLALGHILTHQTSIPADTFHLVVLSARRSWPAAKVFDTFAPWLQRAKPSTKAYADALIRSMQLSVADTPSDDSGGDQETHVQREATLAWDPRWLDVAIKADRKDMVHLLARPGHKGVVGYLLKQLEGKAPDLPSTFAALRRCQFPQLTKTFLGLVAKRTKGVKQVDYTLIGLFHSARHLPAADLPLLDDFATQLDEVFVDRFLEALTPLRMQSQTLNSSH